MIFDFLFYYLFKLFKLFKSDDDIASFKSIIVLSCIGYLNVMSLILLVKASEFVTIQGLEIINIVFLCLSVFTLFYFIYGYKNKYKERVQKVETSFKKQKIIFALISLIYVILSFSLPFIFGIYYNVSLLD